MLFLTLSCQICFNSPSPSRFILNFNRMNNLWYEQNHYLEKQCPSFEPLGIIIFLQFCFIFLLLLSQYFCISVNRRDVTFTTNLTLNHKKKDISRLPQSVTLVSLLLVGLLSAGSPENYLSILIILPDLDYGLYVQFSIKIS